MNTDKLTARIADIEVPLSYKILGATVLLLACMSLLFLFIFIRVYQTRLINDYTEASVNINSLLEASLENAMLKRDIPGLQQIVGKLGEQPAIEGVYIVDPNMEIRFSSSMEKNGQSFYDPQALVQPGQVETNSRFIDTQKEGTEETVSVLRSVNPVLNRTECEVCHGTVQSHPVNGYLVIDYVSDTIHKSARNATLSLALSGGLVVLLTILAIAWVLKKLVVDPLERMNTTCQTFGQGDLSARCGVTGGDEIGSLGASLDNMAEQLGVQRRKLQQNRSFIQSVIDAVPDGIRVIGPDYRIQMVNKAYCDQQEAAAESVIGQHCYVSTHARNEPCAASLITCPLYEFKHGDKKRLKCRHRHIKSSGEELFTEVYAGRLQSGPDGESGEFFVESIRDLAAEISLSQEQRLSEVGHLATGVAHEIHNPLSSISLAIRSISCDIKDTETAERISPYLQIVTDEIERCINITQRLLKLSQPDSNQRVLLDLAEVAREVLALLEFQAEREGIKITTISDPDARVLADSADMHMLILNTVLNSFHAMKDGGELKVLVKRTPERVELVIEDTGCGIKPENAAKVFWPFWSQRADQSTGNGLGLPICRSIVEKHQGTIKLHSIPDSGTTLVVRFPAADYQAGAVLDTPELIN